MKTYALSILMLAAVSLSHGREFTDSQGRKLDAELVSVTNGQATLKRSADGRSFTLPVTNFIADDQKFMNEFAASSMNYGFDVRYTKKKLNEVKRKKGPVTYETETWTYRVDLRNNSSGAVTDLRVDYWCFLREDGGKGKGTPKIESSGSTRIENLARSATLQFDTLPFEINKQQLAGGWYWGNGDKNQQSDGVGGLAIRIFKGDKEVYKYATKDDLLEAAVGKPTGSKPTSEGASSSR